MVEVVIADVVIIETISLQIDVVSQSIAGRMEHVHMTVVSVNHQHMVTNRTLHLKIN